MIHNQAGFAERRSHKLLAGRYRREKEVQMAFVLAGIVAVALLAYLVYALFHPDKLS